jgi:hypothetical protein
MIYVYYQDLNIYRLKDPSTWTDDVNTSEQVVSYFQQITQLCLIRHVALLEHHFENTLSAMGTLQPFTSRACTKQRLMPKKIRSVQTLNLRVV